MGTLEAINSYDGTTLSKNGILITTKTDKERHGLGLRIVKEIVQSHGGVRGSDATSRTVIIENKQ